MSAATKTAPSVGDVLSGAVERLNRSGVGHARPEARALLEHVLGQPRSWLIAHPEAPVPDHLSHHFEGLLARRCASEPLAYILGEREFFGLPFYVDPRALIPRLETELLVERALSLLDEQKLSAPVLVDVGTGSGAISVSFSLARPDARLFAIDRSEAALHVARINAERHGVANRVRLLCSDLLAGLRVEADVILANLPYIPTAELETLPPEVARYEPIEALDGGPDGMALTVRLLRESPEVLRAGGALILECEPNQVSTLADVGRGEMPGCSTEVLYDGFGHARALMLRSR